MNQVSTIISSLAFPSNVSEDLFAFSYLPMLDHDNGWSLYNPVAEVG